MDKFQRFMNGRYGVDQLNTVLLLFSIILSVMALIIDSQILNIISSIILAIIIFRALSKNRINRARENEKFLKWYNPLKNTVIRRKNRFKDLKNYRYLKCPECRQTLRVPRKKGKILITCPKCHHKFKTKT